MNKDCRIYATTSRGWVTDDLKLTMVIGMKYVVGSLIISFGVLFVVIVLLTSVGLQAPENTLKYMGLAWVLLAAATYPLSKKVIR